MGADLSRLAVIPDPGADPVEVAAVLMDGMDLVVLGLGGRSVPPTRARAVTARAGRRAARCWSPTVTGTGPDAAGGQGLRLRDNGCGRRCADAGVRPDQPGAAGDQGRGSGKWPCSRSGRMTCLAGCWPSGAWTGPRWPRPPRRACPRPRRWRSRWPTAWSPVRRRHGRPGCGAACAAGKRRPAARTCTSSPPTRAAMPGTSKA